MGSCWPGLAARRYVGPLSSAVVPPSSTVTCPCGGTANTAQETGSGTCGALRWVPTCIIQAGPLWQPYLGHYPPPPHLLHFSKLHQEASPRWLVSGPSHLVHASCPMSGRAEDKQEGPGGAGLALRAAAWPLPPGTLQPAPDSWSSIRRPSGRSRAQKSAPLMNSAASFA